MKNLTYILTLILMLSLCTVFGQTGCDTNEIYNVINVHFKFVEKKISLNKSYYIKDSIIPVSINNSFTKMGTPYSFNDCTSNFKLESNKLTTSLGKLYYSDSLTTEMVWIVSTPFFNKKKKRAEIFMERLSGTKSVCGLIFYYKKKKNYWKNASWHIWWNSSNYNFHKWEFSAWLNKLWT